MRGFISRLTLALRALFLPVVVLVAFALIAFGVWLIYPPAGYITAGVLLLLVVIDARR